MQGREAGGDLRGLVGFYDGPEVGEGGV
jgi:hypothetical protein